MAIIDSLGRACGLVKLLNAAKLASEKLGMKFEEHEEDRYGRVARITKRKIEYHIYSSERSQDAEGMGSYGYYSNTYSLNAPGGLILDSHSYASWNSGDAGTSTKSETNLYVEDRLGREIFNILKNGNLI